MEKGAKIYIAGHRGMVGSAILRKLETLGYSNFVLKRSNELDLRNQAEVASFFSTEKPEYVSAFNQVKARYHKLIELYDICLKEHNKLIANLDNEVRAGVELRKSNIKLKKDNAALKAMLPSSI
jgi:hypothetical protein